MWSHVFIYVETANPTTEAAGRAVLLSDTWATDLAVGPVSIVRAADDVAWAVTGAATFSVGSTNPYAG